MTERPPVPLSHIRKATGLSHETIRRDMIDGLFQGLEYVYDEQLGISELRPIDPPKQGEERRKRQGQMILVAADEAERYIQKVKEAQEHAQRPNLRREFLNITLQSLSSVLLRQRRKCLLRA